MIRTKLTKKQIDELTAAIVVVVDTREKANEHIKAYFDKHKIPYVYEKLETGDYAAFVPGEIVTSVLGIPSGAIHFDFAIERKNSIDELAGNLKEDRFENELIRAERMERFLLLIEDEYKNLLLGNYRSQWKPQSLLAKLMALTARHGFEMLYMSDKTTVGNYIYYTLKYHAREVLKRL